MYLRVPLGRAPENLMSSGRLVRSSLQIFWSNEKIHNKVLENYVFFSLNVANR